VIRAKVEELARLNLTRADWLEHFQELIEEYNAGSLNAETTFERRMLFTQGLGEEEQRRLSEGLTEEQLAIYDLLTRPGPDSRRRRRGRSSGSRRSHWRLSSGTSRCWTGARGSRLRRR